ncbi:MAG: hypothetical protein UW63_C0092G0004 [Candidatus Uhrbacteria bacterium GW2011_GWF2_44_350]|uniref:Uncharacterized protein n=1 Tax=Candidatus Uhrbacteria bacterium GW2011_GWF2_44_350 TaxID=1619000 RepID=A0A0G1J992_9BACT|nr:MAG: hypothetical protein UW63_C0092G0004 [Candidatus Uhrbacteria bacterium GW2011_GWF2_44_350]
MGEGLCVLLLLLLLLGSEVWIPSDDLEEGYFLNTPIHFGVEGGEPGQLVVLGTEPGHGTLAPFPGDERLLRLTDVQGFARVGADPGGHPGPLVVVQESDLDERPSGAVGQDQHWQALDFEPTDDGGQSLLHPDGLGVVLVPLGIEGRCDRGPDSFPGLGTVLGQGVGVVSTFAISVQAGRGRDERGPGGLAGGGWGGLGEGGGQHF